ncbi:MAG: hypothetical protein JNK76_20490 [Planctomycetales bacterium]|nr:hypothetical protein [Planctomycetales bacterium]
MLEVQLGDTLEVNFTTHNSDGSNVNADATPTFTVKKNGVDVGALTNVNASSLGTGLYRGQAAITAANGFAKGDKVEMAVTSIVGGVTSTILMQPHQVVNWRKPDGLEIEELVADIAAFLLGERDVADNVLRCKARDGSTVRVTLTMGTTPGEITASEIESDG